jgi:Mesyanzhinovviridae DNA helicase
VTKISELRLNTVLFNHQSAALKRALANPVAFAHLAETGTGKSVVVLAEYQQRLNPKDVWNLLVIAPAGSIRNWYIDKSDEQPSELKRHLDPRLLKSLVIASNRKNAEQRRARESVLAEQKRPCALFVNIESLSRKSSDAEKLCAAFMRQARTMMVIDESTRIRHHSSARSKAIMRLAKYAVSRRILTGLVTPRSPLDIFSQFNFLDHKILNCRLYSIFRARYANMHFICKAPEPLIDLSLKRLCHKLRKPVPLDLTRDQKIHFVYDNGGFIRQTAPIIDSFRNLGELRKIIAPYSFQVLKSECLDLPSKIYEPRDIELTDTQSKLYQQMLNTSMAELGPLTKDPRTFASTVLTKIMRLQRIVSGHMNTEEDGIVDIPSNRIPAIIEVLDEHEGKAIIWTPFDPEIRKIAAALQEEYGEDSVARFWGGNARTRAEDEKRFLNDPNCRFMVSTPASGGVGNTWNVANLVIYAANDYDLEHRFQSEDRCHRIGQHKNVTYIDLIVRGTVEESIIRALRKKIDLTRAITGENYRKWLI